MPTLAQMEAATPKCPRTMARRTPPLDRIVDGRCAAPLTYVLARNIWQCEMHGDVWTGEELGALLNDDAAAAA